MQELREAFERMRVDSGLAELEPAVRRKLVRFNENIALGEETDTVIGTFIEELKRYLLDPKWFVLVDDDVASLARGLINEGHLTPPQRAISNASEAALGTGFLGRLPASPLIQWTNFSISVVIFTNLWGATAARSLTSAANSRPNHLTSTSRRRSMLSGVRKWIQPLGRFARLWAIMAWFAKSSEPSATTCPASSTALGSEPVSL